MKVSWLESPKQNRLHSIDRLVETESVAVFGSAGRSAAAMWALATIAHNRSQDRYRLADESPTAATEPWICMSLDFTSGHKIALAERGTAPCTTIEVWHVWAHLPKLKSDIFLWGRIVRLRPWNCTCVAMLDFNKGKVLPGTILNLGYLQ